MLNLFRKQRSSSTERQGEVIPLSAYRDYEADIDFTEEVEVGDIRPSLVLVPTPEQPEVDEEARDSDGPLLKRMGDFTTSLLGYEDRV